MVLAKAGFQMALKDYFELTAMLRMQLPVLLSFAFMRCLIGYWIIFWVGHFAPAKIASLCNSAQRVAHNVTLALNLVVLSSAYIFSMMFVNTWSQNAERERPRVELECAEFACTRAQGLVCALALFTICTRGEPFTLSLALATLKGVADGTVYSLVMAAYTLAACAGAHRLKPRLFFGILYMLSTFYCFRCHTEDDVETRGRIGAAVLSVSFSSLFLSYKTVRYLVHAIKSRFISLFRFAVKQFQRLRAKID